MAWKYIMFQVGMFKMPVVFPDKLIHDHVASVLLPLLRADFPRFKVGVASAGMIEHVEVLDAGSESETMGVRSCETDGATINTYSYTHGV